MVAAVEAIGLGGSWEGLDLRRTASGLYAAMGQRNLDPAALLVQHEETPEPPRRGHLRIVR